MKPLDKTVRDVLIDAVHQKQQSRAYFRELANRASEESVRAKLLEISEKELLHRVKLERRFKETFGEEAPEPETTPVEIPPNLGLLDMKRVLKLALDHERASEGNYRHFAERAEEKEIRALYHELAEMEWNRKFELEADLNDLSEPDDFLEDL